jgi:hypothetical protein
MIFSAFIVRFLALVVKSEARNSTPAPDMCQLRRGVELGADPLTCWPLLLGTGSKAETLEVRLPMKSSSDGTAVVPTSADGGTAVPSMPAAKDCCVSCRSTGAWSVWCCSSVCPTDVEGRTASCCILVPPPPPLSLMVVGESKPLGIAESLVVV